MKDISLKPTRIINHDIRDREVGINHLNTDCLLVCKLQQNSESIAVMSRSQQQDGVI